MDGDPSQTSCSSDRNSEEKESNNSAEKSSSDDENSKNESAKVYSYSLFSDLSNGESTEDSSSSSEKSSYDKELYVREFGLVFLKSRRKENWDIKIVIVGHKDCGKTQLIKSVFADHPSFDVWRRLSDRVEYLIKLNKRARFKIWIYDAMDVKYAKEGEFNRKTMFFFCYDEGDLYTLKDLEDTWIPIFFTNFDETMSHMLVGIERDPATEEMAAERVKNQEEFKAAKEKLSGLFLRNHSSCVSCSFNDKKTMLDVFQSAIDDVYPRVQSG